MFMIFTIIFRYDSIWSCKGSICILNYWCYLLGCSHRWICFTPTSNLYQKRYHAHKNIR